MLLIVTSAFSSYNPAAYNELDIRVESEYERPFLLTDSDFLEDPEKPEANDQHAISISSTSLWYSQAPRMPVRRPLRTRFGEVT